MLGVFCMSAGKINPELSSPNNYPPALKDRYLEKAFLSKYNDSEIVHLEEYGFLAYSKDPTIFPRPIYDVQGSIYLLMKCNLTQEEHDTYSSHTVKAMFESYLDVRDYANKAAKKAMTFLGTDNNYVIYDRSMGGAIVARAMKDISLYYGFDAEGSFITTDDMEIIKKVCGESFETMPEGKAALISVIVPLAKEESTEARSMD